MNADVRPIAAVIARTSRAGGVRTFKPERHINSPFDCWCKSQDFRAKTAVGDELARRIEQPAFRGRDCPSAMHNRSFGSDLTTVGGHRTDHIPFELNRRVLDAGCEGGEHCTTHARIEHRGCKGAVRCPSWIVMSSLGVPPNTTRPSSASIKRMFINACIGATPGLPSRITHNCPRPDKTFLVSGGIGAGTGDPDKIVS